MDSDLTTVEPRLLHADDHVAWVYKPAGMQVHRQHRGDSGPFLLQWLREALGCYVYPTHRLDKPTAGLMLFGLSSEAASRIGRAFQERDVQKRYLAVVRGHTAAQGCIDYALDAVRDDMDVRPDHPRPAVTRFRALNQCELPHPVGRYQTARYSLLELVPETGRRHQLRRHLKHVFHPVLGDRKYGDRDHNRFWAEQGHHRLALVSVGLSVPSLNLQRTCRPDREWQRLVSDLRLDSAFGENAVDG